MYVNSQDKKKKKKKAAKKESVVCASSQAIAGGGLGKLQPFSLLFTLLDFISTLARLNLPPTIRKNITAPPAAAALHQDRTDGWFVKKN